MLNEISSTLINATIKTQNEFQQKKTKKKKLIGDLKYKAWWDSTIQELHNNVISSYIVYRESNFVELNRKVYYTAKRLFRAIKRYNIRLKTDNNLRKIDELFKLNKQGFCKKIKSMQSKNSKVEIDINKIKREYERLFTERNDVIRVFENSNNVKFNESIAKHENEEFGYSLLRNLGEAINKLKIIKWKKYQI